MQNVVNLAAYRDERAKSVEMQKPVTVDDMTDQEKAVLSRREYNRKLAEREPKIMELAKLLTVARYRYEDNAKFPNFTLNDEFKPMDAFIAQAVGFHGDEGLVDYMIELLRRETENRYQMK